MEFRKRSILHIANTDFEEELETGRPFFSSPSPIYLQLQYLPELYADTSSEALFCQSDPSSTRLSIETVASIEAGHYRHLEPWGHTPSMATFAQKYQIPYRMPSWEVIQQVNSKLFSWQAAPLPSSEVLSTLEEVKRWACLFPGPKVLKTCYGVAGRGHLFDWTRLEAFCAPQFKRNLPLIGEPWVARRLDFSTQWIIHQNQQLEYVGATVCLNSSKGSYLATKVGNPSDLFGSDISFLESHKIEALKVLQKMASLGFFGHVGIDAYIYNQDQLHPIVEINARKTMGFVALKLQQRLFPKEILTLSYKKNGTERGLLPLAVLKEDGSQTHFFKNLHVQRRDPALG